MIKSKKSQTLSLSEHAQIAFQHGDYQKTSTYLQQAIKLAPNDPTLYIQQAQICHALGKDQAAHQHLDRAIQIDANNFEAHHQKAGLFKENFQYQEALNYFNLALTINPNHVMAYVNCGNTLLEMQQFEFALAHHDFALSIDPHHIAALNGRALALHGLNQHAEALKCFEYALALDPTSALTCINLATVYDQLDLRDQAIQLLEKIKLTHATDVQILCNLGKLYEDVLNIPLALENYQQALSISPNDKLTHWNLAHLYLKIGNFKDGWQLYESGRDAIPTLKMQRKNCAQPLWLGQASIAGKRLLIYAEQGLGDTFQFIRYVDQLIALGAKVILELPKSLISIIQFSYPHIHIIEKSQPFTDFDYHTSMMSLPLAFKTNLSTIPANIPYLFAQKEKVKKFNIAHINQINIGLVWSGSTIHHNDANRSIALEQLRPLLDINANFHCLQKEIREIDYLALDNLPDLKTYTTQLNDFSDTAALIDAMDLIISVDTSVAHLAGAMGKPVWILLPSTPDFRWMLNTEDSPWYPTARLFRQEILGSWERVIQTVALELKELVKSSLMGRMNE
jgi:tetratricopeptide (TPR) repeat protein